MSDLQGFGVYNNQERMAPVFRLPATITPKPVALWDYKQRQAVVLYFLPQATELQLNERQQEYAAYRTAGAEMLVIVPQTIAELTRLAEELKLTYPLLSDQAGTVYQQYLKFVGITIVGELLPAIFIADRFGAVSRYAIANDLSGLQPQVLDMLEFLGNLCNP